MRYRPTLERAPTEANLRRARLQLKGIKERIAHGTFSFAEEFPEYRFRKHVASLTAARTCNDVFDEFLAHVDSRVVKHDLAFATGDSYRKTLSDVLRPKLGTRLFSEVRYSELMKIADARAKSKKTYNNVVSVLRCAFDYGYRDTPEKHNPATGLKCLRITKKDRPVIDPFSIQEAEALIAAIHRDWGEAQGNYDEFRFFTGLRPSEQIAVLVSDCDIAHGKISVSKAHVMARDKDRTKTSTDRLVELCPRALQVLKRHLALRACNWPARSSTRIFSSRRPASRSVTSSIRGCAGAARCGNGAPRLSGAPSKGPLWTWRLALRDVVHVVAQILRAAFRTEVHMVTGQFAAALATCDSEARRLTNAVNGDELPARNTLAALVAAPLAIIRIAVRERYKVLFEARCAATYRSGPTHPGELDATLNSNLPFPLLLVRLSFFAKHGHENDWPQQSENYGERESEGEQLSIGDLLTARESVGKVRSADSAHLVCQGSSDRPDNHETEPDKKIDTCTKCQHWESPRIRFSVGAVDENKI